MRKLEDIPKRTPFKVPEGYFDKLPTVIQARMGESRRTRMTSVVSFSLKFALPVVALIVAGIFWLRPDRSAMDQLEDIDTQQIALYLANTDRVDLEDVHEAMDWTTKELDVLQDSVYSNMEYKENIDDILEDLDLENL
jgi:hypothetical protein